MGKASKSTAKDVDAIKTALKSKVWLRIDASTIVLVTCENATAEYAASYRKRLADFRGSNHHSNN